jgi:DNA-binding response OmpR family regulator
VKTILLLEDEPSLLNLLNRVLVRRGYSVLQAATPEDALRLFDHGERRVDLIIADVTLPVVSGVQVALLLRTELPDLPVILTSGYPSTAWTDQDCYYLRRLGPNLLSILLKPFPSRTLLDTVGGLIGDPWPDVLSAGVS